MRGRLFRYFRAYGKHFIITNFKKKSKFFCPMLYSHLRPPPNCVLEIKIQIEQKLLPSTVVQTLHPNTRFTEERTVDKCNFESELLSWKRWCWEREREEEGSEDGERSCHRLSWSEHGRNMESRMLALIYTASMSPQSRPSPTFPLWWFGRGASSCLKVLYTYWWFFFF